MVSLCRRKEKKNGPSCISSIGHSVRMVNGPQQKRILRPVTCQEPARSQEGVQPRTGESKSLRRQWKCLHFSLFTFHFIMTGFSGTKKGCSFQYNESRLMHHKSGSHKSRSLLSLIFLISHMIQFTKSIWRICSLIELLWFFWVQSFQWASWSSSQISLNDFFTNWTDLVFWVRSFQWVSWSSSHHQSKWFVHELDFCSFESDHFHDSRDPVSKISLNDLFTHWTY